MRRIVSAGPPAATLAEVAWRANASLLVIACAAEPEVAECRNGQRLRDEARCPVVAVPSNLQSFRLGERPQAGLNLTEGRPGSVSYRLAGRRSASDPNRAAW